MQIETVAEATARSHGWQENEHGHWERPGTAHDPLTLHRSDDDDNGYVLARTAEEACRMDREASAA